MVKSSGKWYVAGSLSNVVALFDALFTCVISKISDVFWSTHFLKSLLVLELSVTRWKVNEQVIWIKSLHTLR